MYANPVWSNTCRTNIKKLETAQNKVLRQISNEKPNISNAKIREKLNATTLWETITDSTYTFYTTKVKDIDILKDVGIYNYETAPFKIKYKLPHQILINEQLEQGNTCNNVQMN